MRIRRIINSHYPTLKPDDLATHARALMRDLNLSVIPVVRNGDIIGVVRRVHVLSLTSTRSNALVHDIMDEAKVVFRDDEDLESAINIMIELDEWYTPVVNSRSNKYVGMASLESFLVTTSKSLRRILNENQGFGISVSNIMTRNVEYVTPEENISKVWRRMLELRISGFPVVKSKRKLDVIGMITQHDLLRKGYTRIELESERGPRKGPKVKDAMTTPAITLSPSDDIVKALEIMVKKDIGRIPIVSNDNTLVGIVDRSDLSRAVLKHNVIKKLIR